MSDCKLYCEFLLWKKQNHRLSFSYYVLICSHIGLAIHFSTYVISMFCPTFSPWGTWITCSTTSTCVKFRLHDFQSHQIEVHSTPHNLWSIVVALKWVHNCRTDWQWGCLVCLLSKIRFYANTLKWNSFQKIIPWPNWCPEKKSMMGCLLDDMF